MPLVQQLKKLPKPDLCPDAVYDVMMDCWRIDPSTRVTAAAIKQRVSSHRSKQHQLQPPQADTGVYVEPAVWPRLSDLQQSSEQSNTNESSTDAQEHGVDIKSEQARSAFSSLETPRAHIIVTGQLGSGAFGEVKRATLSSKSEVAVKTLKNGGDRELREKFLTEARILAVLKHAHIVKLIGVCTCEAPYWMIIELMPLGEFLSYLRDHSPTKAPPSHVFTPDSMLTSVTQIADAMRFLESKRVVHRDLAAR